MLVPMRSDDGVDDIVFTAGIGENDDYVREQVCSYLGYLGVDFDKEKNDGLRGKQEELTKAGIQGKSIVIPTMKSWQSQEKRWRL